MAQEIQVTSDKSGSLEKIQGSDGRLNTSSRSDGRSYYNSRDESESFSLIWDDATSASGDYVLYWKNTDVTGRVLVIESIGVNSTTAGIFKVSTVTGTASGVSVTPTCLNRSQPRSAVSVCVEAAGTAITGLTEDLPIDIVACTATGHEEMRLKDRVRLGQDQAIAIECELGTGARTWGVVFGYFE